MPYIGFDVEHETKFQENRRFGSVLLMVGWILLGMAGITGIYVFQDIREGTFLWLVWNGVLGVLGLGFVAVGTHYRRRVPR